MHIAHASRAYAICVLNRSPRCCYIVTHIAHAVTCAHAMDEEQTQAQQALHPSRGITHATATQAEVSSLAQAMLICCRC